MVMRKFEQELLGAMACNSLAPAVSEMILRKKQKLPIPPKIGARPIINIKLSLEDNPEISERVMLHSLANVAVISQTLVGEYRIPVVLRERAEIITGYDGAVSKGAVSTHTFAYTLSLADHYTKASFEMSPLQGDHDILML